MVLFIITPKTPSQIYTVPAGSTVTFTVNGPSGGNTTNGDIVVLGGLGGQITGTFTVPGITYFNLYAGGQGMSVQTSNSPVAGGLGGSGGTAPSAIAVTGGSGGFAVGPGAGGGGGSQIALGGVNISLIIAGGGGGAGGLSNIYPMGGAPGGAGGPTPTAGTNGTAINVPTGGSGGLPGSAGASGGQGNPNYPLTYGLPGQLRSGGNAGYVADTSNLGAGGGGGGGGYGGGGGGGATVTPSITSGAGGGGGCNFVGTIAEFPITITGNGVNPTRGDGQITWNVAIPGPSPATPTLTFTFSFSSIRLGSVNKNQTVTVTVSNGNSPTGSLTVTLYSDPQGTNVISSTNITVNGNGTYATTFSSSLFTAGVGTYSVQVIYSGDLNNNGVISNLQTFLVTRAHPKIRTRARLCCNVFSSFSFSSSSPSSYDKAWMTQAYQPSGILKFTLYKKIPKSSSICNGDIECWSFKPIFVTEKQVQSNQFIYKSRAFIFPSHYQCVNTSCTSTCTCLKMYVWRVTYSGDRNNKPYKSSFCDSEETFYLRK